ncbi:Lipid phosphate phosphohydrolase 1 [Wickerhamomyces ciferrii]|uniref:Lipid phosphate phosphohydrolase 1 n=1 Tax=Wickerhamomyces ciferrii (strain ATCC 14091 / BCRC 22168 / CBS 111 / JCM 3599 / NBRC 0793 / NRRL Y-1031 F-60-10) TaxID=1206466 RepID=K0KR56_WICCF|nr:Lipid phosphate phosphohydrolase 1 [Wickerhamomyces ciferrii]CCH43768.1 Lipid phosphate phosphohydrolase 1 [Wickerhamomyces ciferrii]
MVLFNSIKKFSPEWALVVSFTLYYAIIGSKQPPFLREFLINDPTIQHPFTQFETIDDKKCILISSLVPLVLICLVTLGKHNWKFNKIINNNKFFNFLHLSILGLALSLSITGFITFFLKNMIARPRPDFIDRCKPDLLKIKPNKFLYSIDICTNDNYELILEGLRSTPSGHASIAFSGLHYVTLFLFAQLSVWSNRKRIHLLLLSVLPEFIALFIALSRTQDYRHHFGDIFMGTLIGVGISYITYRKIFPSFADENYQDVYYLKEHSEILPLYQERERSV